MGGECQICLGKDTAMLACCSGVFAAARVSAQFVLWNLYSTEMSYEAQSRHEGAWKGKEGCVLTCRFSSFSINSLLR